MKIEFAVRFHVPLLIPDCNVRQVFQAFIHNERNCSSWRSSTEIYLRLVSTMRTSSSSTIKQISIPYKDLKKKNLIDGWLSLRKIVEQRNVWGWHRLHWNERRDSPWESASPQSGPTYSHQFNRVKSNRTVNWYHRALNCEIGYMNN